MKPGSCLVAVQDSGIGVDQENMGRTIEPFYTTKPEGMGMGLRISRSIIEAHGGRLWAALTPGQASPFNLLCRSAVEPQHREWISRDLLRPIKFAFANYGALLRLKCCCSSASPLRRAAIERLRGFRSRFHAQEQRAELTDLAGWFDEFIPIWLSRNTPVAWCG
jgi:hypothetical protein